jgi:hypothetical protein
MLWMLDKKTTGLLYLTFCGSGILPRFNRGWKPLPQEKQFGFFS